MNQALSLSAALAQSVASTEALFQQQALSTLVSVVQVSAAEMQIALAAMSVRFAALEQSNSAAVALITSLQSSLNNTIEKLHNTTSLLTQGICRQERAA